MKLPDCAFNMDVKNGYTFLDSIILWGVTAGERRGEIKNTLYKDRALYFPKNTYQTRSILQLSFHLQKRGLSYLKFLQLTILK